MFCNSATGMLFVVLLLHVAAERARATSGDCHAAGMTDVRSSAAAHVRNYGDVSGNRLLTRAALIGAATGVHPGSGAVSGYVSELLKRCTWLAVLGIRGGIGAHSLRGNGDRGGRGGTAGARDPQGQVGPRRRVLARRRVAGNLKILLVEPAEARREAPDHHLCRPSAYRDGGQRHGGV